VITIIILVTHHNYFRVCLVHVFSCFTLLHAS
jgi:hypothetical protein